MKPEGRKRKTKWFANTNSSYLASEFDEWLKNNPDIDIEHIVSIADTYSHLTLVTYFEMGYGTRPK